MYMPTLPLAAARAALSKIVDSAARTHERFEITRNGHRAAVLLGADDYDSLMETLAVLSDRQLVEELLEGFRDIGAGDTIDAAALETMMRDAGRLPHAER